ncbi:MAG: AAA family ATPase [bacterium]|nr:AAA family ATPase [bacterium]
MATINIVEDIVKAFSSGKNEEVVSVLEKEIKKQRANGKILVAKRLSNLIKDVSRGHSLSGQSLTSRNINLNNNDTLFEKIYSNIELDSVVLNPNTRTTIIEFIKHWEAFDKLLKNNISPINKILFYGPPGTGKTRLAYALANKLNLPLIIVKLDELVSSYLGKTGKNISEVFEIAKRERVVIFFDEIDTVAKHRDDARELGELKRVVTVLLQNIDLFPVTSILIGATNHDELLDKALWRRFGLRLEINTPEEESRALLFELFLSDFNKNKSLDYNLMARVTVGLNGSLINDICQNIKRASVIEGISLDNIFCLKHIISFNHQLTSKQRLNKKNLYEIAQVLKDSSFNLIDISEVSGIAYTTLRDNIK